MITRAVTAIARDTVIARTDTTTARDSALDRDTVIARADTAVARSDSIITDDAIGAVSTSVGSVDTNRTLGDILVSDVEALGTDALAFISAPARFGSVEWTAAGLFVGGTVALMHLDESLRREVAGASVSDDAASILKRSSDFGELLYANILTTATYVTGLAAGSDMIRVTGRLMAQSLLYSGAVTMSLRYLFGRQRPYNSASAWRFEYFESSNEIQSFPSGHTTVAFALASVLADRISHPAATVVLYSAASLTALSRVYLDRHWSSDVFVGAAIGTASGIFVSRRENARAVATTGAPAASPPSGSLRVTPTFNGLAVVVTF